MWRKLALAGVLAGLLACNDESAPNISGVDGGQIASVTIQPVVDTLFIPDTIRATDRLQLSAVATATTGVALKKLRYVWASSDSTIARVDSVGLVTPIRTGSVVITASAARVGTATVVILPAANRLVVTPAIDTIFVDDPIVSTRDTVRLSVAAFDPSGAPLTGVRYTWQSATPTAATVDSLGTVRAIGLGSSILTVRAPLRLATATVAVLPVVRNVVVTDPLPQSVDGDTVQLVARAFDYTNQVVTRKFAWRSLNPTVATIDTNGRVIFIAPGSATLSVTTAFVADSVTVISLPRQLLSLDVGGDYSCGVATLGRAYCWGKGTVGQLGSAADSTCVDNINPTARVACAIAPKRVIAPAIAFSVVVAGDSTSCGISSAQQLYCWGDDTYGQIGNGSGGGGAQPRLATVASERFTSLTSGGGHACALNLAGLAYCWGKDSTGQLGDARNVNSTTPIPVIGPDSQPSGALRYTAISAGANHTCAIAADRRAWCWGAGSRGVLGTGDTLRAVVPKRVVGDRLFIAISAGTDHTCALGTDGGVYCWGDNTLGQLGLGTTTLSFSSSPVASLESAGYTAISSGVRGSCALSGGGSVFCWGHNEYGQLGRGEPLTVPNPGSFSPIPSPIINPFAKQFTSLSVGRRHACALASDNTTWCWGSNFLGSLGNQLQAAIRTTPVQVARLR